MILFDLDDYYTEGENNCLEELNKMKDKYPNLKVTLFTIIGKCDPSQLILLSDIQWIQLAAHGHDHDKNSEVMDWDSAQWYRVINEYEEFGFQHIFKAPNWEMSKLGYQVLKDLKWAVAVRKNQIKDVPEGLFYYCFENEYDAVHGHTWLLKDHEKKGWFKSWDKNSKFGFISDWLVIE